MLMLTLMLKQHAKCSAVQRSTAVQHCSRIDTTDKPHIILYYDHDIYEGHHEKSVAV